MRRRILIAVERVEGCADKSERRRLLTFVIIGGRPTGVELAAALTELAKAALARDFGILTTARVIQWVKPDHDAGDNPERTCRGFAVKVMRSGRKTYVVSFRHNGIERTPFSAHSIGSR
jgi:hypothetical protein